MFSVVLWDPLSGRARGSLCWWYLHLGGRSFRSHLSFHRSLHISVYRRKSYETDLAVVVVEGEELVRTEVIEVHGLS